MLRWYQACLAKRPLLTQSVTSAVLFGTGDVLAQQLVDRVGPENHSLARTGRMALYGGVIFGPAATTWFKFLQRNIAFKSKPVTIGARVACDQLLFTPTHMFCFLSSMSIMEGKDPVHKLKTSFLPAYKTNLMVWPWIQGANFSVVPLEHRVLVVNIVSLGWNCFLSFINSQG